jgi:hypothetical protein
VTDFTPNGADDAPQILETVDPASDIGRLLHDSVAKLRFANVDPEVREMAQQILQGRATANDLMKLPEFQPLLENARSRFNDDLAQMTDEEREAFFRPNPLHETETEWGTR